MFKMSIASDSRKKQQYLRCRDLGRKKKWNFCAHATRQHRRNEWAHRPSLPRHVKRSSRFAVIVAQESAEPLVTFDDSTSQPRTTTASVVS